MDNKNFELAKRMQGRQPSKKKEEKQPNYVVKRNIRVHAGFGISNDVREFGTTSKIDAAGRLKEKVEG